MKTEPIPRRSKISTLDLYLLVSSVVELHEVTTLKILGNEVCRTRQPLLGSVPTSTGKQDAHDYQSNHSTQDTNTLGSTERYGLLRRKRQQAALTTRETRYNLRLKERDKRAYRNQLPLLTKQTHPGFTP